MLYWHNSYKIIDNFLKIVFEILKMMNWLKKKFYENSDYIDRVPPKKKKKVLNKVTDEKIEVPACKCITIFI